MTPGSAASSCSTRLKSTALRALSYPVRCGTIWKVAIWSIFTPRSTRLTFIRLLRKSADMINSPMDSAICAVTSPARKRAAERPPAIWPAPARMALMRSLRVLCSAGNSPKTTPVTRLSSAENTRTDRLIEKCNVFDASGGSSALITLSVHVATSNDTDRPRAPASRSR